MRGIIYKATNQINGKVYIGQTSRKLNRRIIEHFSDKRLLRLPFSRALKKYGQQSFEFIVIDFGEDKPTLDEKEKHWIDFYDCKSPQGYNLTDGGDGTSGIKRPDISEINRRKVGEKNPMYGVRYTDEQKKLFGSSGEKNPNFGKHWDDEHRQLISLRTREAMQRPEVRERFMAAISKKDNHGDVSCAL